MVHKAAPIENVAHSNAVSMEFQSRYLRQVFREPFRQLFSIHARSLHTCIQTRAVSRRNRSIAPIANRGVHAATLNSATDVNPPTSGARANWQTPYTGVNFAMVCITGGRAESGMKRPPNIARIASSGPTNCMTFSDGSRNPTNRPNAANTREHSHAARNESTQTCGAT